MKLSFFKAAAVASLASVVAFSPLTQAGGHSKQIDSIHFLIPGGAGGGWDGQPVVRVTFSHARVW